MAEKWGFLLAGHRCRQLPPLLNTLTLFLVLKVMTFGVAEWGASLRILHLRPFKSPLLATCRETVFNIPVVFAHHEMYTLLVVFFLNPVLNVSSDFVSAVGLPGHFPKRVTH
ncbi:MAG: hypothetical protein ACE1Z2_01700, partial [Acidobacteriota bacterium]